nr:hypothetical protein Iba_chr06cCG5330 [Ipomoea batatas]
MRNPFIRIRSSLSVLTAPHCHLDTQGDSSLGGKMFHTNGKFFPSGSAVTPWVGPMPTDPSDTMDSNPNGQVRAVRDVLRTSDSSQSFYQIGRAGATKIRGGFGSAQDRGGQHDFYIYSISRIRQRATPPAYHLDRIGVLDGEVFTGKHGFSRHSAACSLDNFAIIIRATKYACQCDSDCSGTLSGN